MVGTSSKLNAAGMSPEHSMVLPERQANAEEQVILNALTEVSSWRASGKYTVIAQS